MDDLVHSLRAFPGKEQALLLSKLYWLVVLGVNELGEIPLKSAIAEGVTDDKLELLLITGSKVDASLDYSGVLRKGITPVLAASIYGRSSMVSYS